MTGVAADSPTPELEEELHFSFHAWERALFFSNECFCLLKWHHMSTVIIATLTQGCMLALCLPRVLSSSSIVRYQEMLPSQSEVTDSSGERFGWRQGTFGEGILASLSMADMALAGLALPPFPLP